MFTMIACYDMLFYIKIRDIVIIYEVYGDIGILISEKAISALAEIVFFREDAPFPGKKRLWESGCNEKRGL